MSQQPRRSGRNRKLTKRLQEWNNLSITSATPSHPRAHVPPIPQLPAEPSAPPPPLLPSTVNSSSLGTHMTFSSAIGRLMQAAHDHVGDDNPPESHDPVAGPSRAPKSRKRQRSSSSSQLPALFNPQDWSRISVPSASSNPIEASRVNPLHIPFVNTQPVGTSSFTLGGTSRTTVGAPEPCASEEESQESDELTVPKWHKTRRPRSSSTLPPPNNISLQSSMFPITGAPMNSSRSPRKFASLLHSESTSESSLTLASGSKFATNVPWKDVTRSSKSTENESVSRTNAALRSTPFADVESNLLTEKKQGEDGSVDTSDQSGGSELRDSSSAERVESKEKNPLSGDNVVLTSAAVSDSENKNPMSGGEWDSSREYRAANAFEETLKTTPGDVSGSATEDAEGVDAFTMCFSEIKLDVWFHTQQDPIEVRITELRQFLEMYKQELWINPPLDVLCEYTPPILSETELDLWSGDKSNPMDGRRVMMWDMVTSSVLPFEQSPLFSKFSKLLQQHSNFEVLSLKSLTHLERIDPNAGAPSSVAMNSKIPVNIGDVARSGLVSRDDLNSSVKKTVGVPDLNPVFSEDERVCQKHTSSDNSTETQPESMPDDAGLQTPEPVIGKEVNPSDMLKVRTESGKESVRPCADVSIQPNANNLEVAGNVTSVLQTATELSVEKADSGSETVTQECGKRKNSENVASTGPCKRQRVVESQLPNGTRSNDSVESTRVDRKSDAADNLLPVSVPMQEAVSDEVHKPLKLKLRIRPDRNSTWLRLRIRPFRERPESLSPKSYTILKPRVPHRFVPEKDKRFRSVVIHQVSARLRYSGLPCTASNPNKETSKAYVFESPVLWDSKKQEKVDSSNVPKRHEDVFKNALFLNPHYEPYTGQDLILKIGEKDHVQLIQISGKTPAALVQFWNRKKRTPQCHDTMKGEKLSVARVYKAFKYLDLYIGQDYRGSPVYRALRATTSMYQRRSLGVVEQYWILVKRPVIVTEFVINGWVPKMVSVHRQMASKSVFWDLENKCLHLVPTSNEKSLAEYIDENNGRFQPYFGQELEPVEQISLYSWHELMKWEPGCRFGDMIPILDGIEAAKREIGGHQRTRISGTKVYVETRPRRGQISSKRKKQMEKRDKRREQDRKRREKKRLEQLREREIELSGIGSSRENLSESADKTDLEIPLSRGREKRERNAKRLPSPEDPEDESDEVGPEMDKFQGKPISAARASELKKLDPSDIVLVRHKRLKVVLPHNQSPQLQNVAKFLQFHDEYEVFDKYRHPVESDTSEAYILAKLQARRQANQIRDVVSTIMAKTTQGDSLEKMRELVEEELSVCGDFDTLVKTMKDGETIPIALKLLTSLEELDVFNFFSDVDENVNMGLDDLLSIRIKFESGDLCLAHDVIAAFRNICAAQIQFNFEHKIVHEAAVTMFAKGEQLFTYFFDEHLAAMRRDRYLYRIRNLVNEAENQMKIVKSTRDIPGVGSSNIVQRNAYMNFRDEVGNSIMSQGVSSRVLGILVDNKPGCLDTIKGREHWKIDGNCHVCGRDVAQPYNEALPCANRLLSECSRIVCRSCLLKKDHEPWEFLELRSRGEWICVHCSGHCKKMKKACSKKDHVVVAPASRTVQFGFDCRFTGWNLSDDIRAVFMRRRLDGLKYEVIGGDEGVKGFVDVNEKNQLWQCTTVLPVGFYRVKMLVNNSSRASTYLYVFPPKCSEPASTVPEAMEVDSVPSNREYSIKVGEHPTVYWKAGRALGNGVPQSLRGNPIRECSRTEGYDWRAAKRHALQLFKPDIAGEVPAQLPTCVSTNFLPLVPMNDELKETDSHAALFDRVMRVEGKRYTEYEHALHTKLFAKMQRESLWGLVVARSSIHGSGLFTLSGFGTGDFIVEYAGVLIRSPLADVREPRYDEDGFGSYMFRLDESHVVDATIHSNRARFVNHSCDPNMESAIVTANGRKLVVFRAKRPIPPFSELTFDYQLPLEDTKMKCLCKAWNCTGVMN